MSPDTFLLLNDFFGATDSVAKKTIPQNVSSQPAKTLLSETGLSPGEMSFQCNSQEAQVSMVTNGLGYSLVPWFMVADQVKAKRLVRIPTAKPLKTPLFRVTRLDAHNRAHERLDEALAAALEN